MHVKITYKVYARIIYSVHSRDNTVHERITYMVYARIIYSAHSRGNLTLFM